MWCKRGEVLVAWRCVVQGHHLKLLWPCVRTCHHPQPAVVCNFNIPAGFVDYVLSIVNADRAVRVVQAPGDDVEGVTELSSPPESPPSTQVEGALSAKEDSVQATPTPLEGKEASAEQSVESPEARPQPSVDTPTERRTPVPRSSSAQSGARCRMATQQMHLASWSVTSFSLMTRASR